MMSCCYLLNTLGNISRQVFPMNKSFGWERGWSEGRDGGSGGAEFKFTYGCCREAHTDKIVIFFNTPIMSMYKLRKKTYYKIVFWELYLVYHLYGKSSTFSYFSIHL